MRASAIVILCSVVAIGCGGSGGGGTAGKPGDGAAGSSTGGKSGTDGGVGGTTGAAGSCGNGLTKKATGDACACAGECSSNFCVDGICCSTACTEACKACTTGTCVSLPASTAPRAVPNGGCTKSEITSCGFDGTCDGAGACRRYPVGTQCSAGQCQGAAVVGSRTCDGLGLCRPGPAIVCAPFGCDGTTGACFDKCAQNSQCVSGQACVNSSCGLKMNGANCMANAECASSHCADGVCCNVACAGGCVSCALVGKRGTCWPADMGAADPRGVCKDTGAATCGTDGKCDGFGSCEKYAPETICVQPSCTGLKRNLPGTCDGLGTCKPPGVQNCAPFLCAAGACTSACKTNADCEPGHACVAGKCGPRVLGGACTAAADCASNHCVDGVCCDTECTGSCKSCALASAPGKCTPIAKGNSDPRGVCVDLKASSCSTNGRCDGAGGCQKYAMGTICMPETCTSNVYHPPATCNTTGQCMQGDALPCSPYVCNGATCFGACTVNENCLQPDNFCIMNSCGKKMQGLPCSATDECQVGLSCAQGFCCDKACAGACQSCALTNSRGTCTNVPTGSADPAGICADMMAPSCGTNGKCQAGACQKYANGTVCKGAVCASGTTTLTRAATCDGSGACVTPPSSSCFPYTCGAGACQNTCTTNAQCAAPALCSSMGSCGLKGNGAPCTDGGECVSKFCAQGLCCNSACNSTCDACNLPSSPGTCSHVPSGAADPQGTCSNQGAATCDMDGTCNGAGACHLYSAGTVCVAPSCPQNGTMLTNARTCDGSGNCQTPTMLACAPYKCNGMAACNAACTVDADCASPYICDSKTNLCGNKKRPGQPCMATGDCLTGDFCVDGVCCVSASCGLCEACNVAPSPGSCADVPADAMDPHARCPGNPPCGNTGACNGAGACQQAANNVSCGAPSCTGSTATLISHCSGAGTCAAPGTANCSPYTCGPNACKTTCTVDGDCMTPYTCQGATGSKSCALKPNGQLCTMFGQCISGNCVDGVCCGSASCLGCQACNIPGSAGACTPVAAGTPAPPSFCADAGPASCGSNGKCDGNGGCQPYANGTPCSLASCPSGSTLTMPGTCQSGACQKPTQSCAPYVCNGVAACQVNCGSDAACTTGNYCTGVGGTCIPKKANGTACTSDNQCAQNHCVDGFCCGVADCGSCKACNVAGSLGTCAAVAAGTDDGSCADQGAPSCGTNGKCDGTGLCQKYPDTTVCSGAMCTSASMLKLEGKCTGGTCTAGSQACTPFPCTANACASICNNDAGCAGGTYCTGMGGTCVAKKANGAVCTGANQCAFGNCVDGVCCDTACTGACSACNLANKVGTCSDVGAGAPDPRGICTAQAPASCGRNGLCDGNGGCANYPDNAPCSTPSCPANMAVRTTAGTCTTGTCAATTENCTPYMCGPNDACRTTCSTDAHCVPGDYCNGTTCVAKKALGATCAADGECSLGNCVENVCCGSAACLKCQSCAVADHLGSCTNVDPGSSDPSGMCMNEGTMGCGHNGKCDGFGECQFYGGATMCAGPTCAPLTNKAVSARFCDGPNHCSDGTSKDCGAYACNAATADCFESCTDIAQCSPGNDCDSGTMSCVSL